MINFEKLHVCRVKFWKGPREAGDRKTLKQHIKRIILVHSSRSVLLIRLIHINLDYIWIITVNCYSITSVVSVYVTNLNLITKCNSYNLQVVKECRFVCLTVGTELTWGCARPFWIVDRILAGCTVFLFSNTILHCC